VSNNKYEIFEAPLKSQNDGFNGDFLCIARNRDFDYWLFYKMTYNFNGTDSKFLDSVKYISYGTYIVSMDRNLVSCYKTATSKESNYGFSNPNGHFDAIGVRKKAYNTSEASIRSGNNYHQNLFSGGKIVKIYKKRKRNLR